MGRGQGGGVGRPPPPHPKPRALCTTANPTSHPTHPRPPASDPVIRTLSPPAHPEPVEEPYGNRARQLDPNPASAPSPRSPHPPLIQSPAKPVLTPSQSTLPSLRSPLSIDLAMGRGQGGGVGRPPPPHPKPRALCTTANPTSHPTHPRPPASDPVIRTLSPPAHPEPVEEPYGNRARQLDPNPGPPLPAPDHHTLRSSRARRSLS